MEGPPATIGVRYICSCLQDEVEVQVRARLAHEDVAFWVGRVVAGAIGSDHRWRSPTCRETNMKHVKIPAPENAPFLGGVPELNS